jgi:hypothetical protein
MADKPSFWSTVWSWLKKFFRMTGAPLIAFVVILGAFLLVMFGFKNLQIGGLLGKLFGKDGQGPQKAVDKANSIPEDRVDKDGKIIKPGDPDSKGQTQAVVVSLEDHGLFDDPSKVKIIPPGEDKPVVIDLPDGVKAKDVDKVIVIKPEVYVVSVKDKSGIKAEDVDSLLEKYGS